MIAGKSTMHACKFVGGFVNVLVFVCIDGGVSPRLLSLSLGHINS